MESNAYELILLDSGFYTKKCSTLSSVDVYEEESGVWSRKVQDGDRIGHGTSVMSIISKHCEGRYAVFKTFDSLKEANIDKILSALTDIYENFSTRFVQMSFGVRGYSEEMDKICRKLYDRGVIILAAFDNYGAISYPAAFPYVIGVSGNVFCLKKDSFIVNDSGIVDILAKSGTQAVVSGNQKGFSLQQGNSFAVSYVSLFLLQANRQFSNKDEVLSYLDPQYRQKKNEYKFKCLGKKVAIFPVNKEMYNLINYADLLKISLADVYDIKYSGNIKKTICNLKKNMSFIVKNIENCEWDSFDTMIIGHLREIGMLLGRNIKSEILSQCLAHKKNVYCYDLYEVEPFRELFRKEGLILECADDYIKNDNYGKLYQIRTPILAVMGTSKKQGKFTLQMQIMKILRERGVKLGALGTEPNSILFGMDSMIPIGYDACINSYSGQYMIEACNEQLHRIDKKGYQLILTGGQSGFLPHFKFNSNHINIGQVAFLQGIQPDGIILAINYRDSIDYIRKAIRSLEVISDVKVFLLAMYAFDTEYDNVIYASKKQLTEEQISEKSNAIMNELGLSLVISGKETYDDIIFDNIINYFCQG